MKGLSDFVKSKRPLSTLQLKQVQKWLDADWESHDMDQNAIKLIRRLLVTCNLLEQFQPLEAPKTK